MTPCGLGVWLSGKTHNCVLLAVSVLRRIPVENFFSNPFPIVQAVFGTCFGYCQESDIFTVLLLAPCSQQIFCIPCVCYLASGNNISFWNISWDDSQTLVTGEPTIKQVFFFCSFFFPFRREQLRWLKFILLSRISLLESWLSDLWRKKKSHCHMIHCFLEQTPSGYVETTPDWQNSWKGIKELMHRKVGAGSMTEGAAPI